MRSRRVPSTFLAAAVVLSAGVPVSAAPLVKVYAGAHSAAWAPPFAPTAPPTLALPQNPSSRSPLPSFESVGGVPLNLQLHVLGAVGARLPADFETRAAAAQAQPVEVDATAKAFMVARDFGGGKIGAEELPAASRQTMGKARALAANFLGKPSPETPITGGLPGAVRKTPASWRLQPAGGPASQAPVSPLDAQPVDAGILLDGRPSPAIEAALIAALTRLGPLPPGVRLTVISGMRDDNPMVSIHVDGRFVYGEFLYHSEANLGRLRRSWLDPRTWLARAPSDDLSKRFEAVLMLARETPDRIQASQGRQDSWLLKP